MGLRTKQSLDQPKGIQVILLFSLLLLFHGLSNYLVLSRSHYSLGPDAVEYYRQIIEMGRMLKNSFSINSLWEYLIGLNKPPFFYLTGSLVSLLSVDKNALIVLNNLFYFAILILATYGIGKLLRDKDAGIFSAFLVSIFPTHFALSRLLMIDFAVSSMVALSLYVILLNNFRSLKYSFLCGIALALGLLTKVTFIVFIIPIFIYNLVLNLRQKNFKDMRFVRGVMVALLVCIVMGLPFYLGNNKDLSIYYHNAFRCNCNYVPFFYLKRMFDRQLGRIFTIFFGISFIYMVSKRKYLFPFSIIFILVLLSTFSCREERLIAPMYIFIALMVTDWAWSLKKLKNILILFLVIFGFINYFIFSYAGPYRHLPEFQSFDKYLFNTVKAIEYGNDIEEGMYQIEWEGESERDAKSMVDFLIGLKKEYEIERNLEVLLLIDSYEIYASFDCYQS